MRTQASPRRPWLTHNLVVLSWVSFFQDTASELLYPILPIFLTTVLGAPIAAVGLIEGLADGAASLSKIISGRFADIRSKRQLVAAGYGLAAAAKIIIAMATVWPLVLVARVVDRIGKGIRGAPRDALIADDTLPEYRGRAFGFHRSMDTAGAVVGPLVGLALYEALHHRFRPLLIVAALPAVVSVALVPLVREDKPTTTARPRLIHKPTRLPRPYWRVVTLLTVFAVVNFSDALLLLRARNLGLGVAAVIFVYVLYNVTYALLSYPAGAVADRLPRRVIFAVGLMTFASAYIALGLVSSAGWCWVLFPVYGLFTALTDGVSRAWLVDLVPADARGRALGLQQGLAGGGTIVAGLWAGLLWRGTGRFPLIFSGLTAVVIAVVLILAGRTVEDNAEAGSPARSGATQH